MIRSQLVIGAALLLLGLGQDEDPSAILRRCRARVLDALEARTTLKCRVGLEFRDSRGTPQRYHGRIEQTADECRIQLTPVFDPSFPGGQALDGAKIEASLSTRGGSATLRIVRDPDETAPASETHPLPELGDADSPLVPAVSWLTFPYRIRHSAHDPRVFGIPGCEPRKSTHPPSSESYWILSTKEDCEIAAGWIGNLDLWIHRETLELHCVVVAMVEEDAGANRIVSRAVISFWYDGDGEEETENK